ncbi:hypothetical protein FRB98_000506 [Tulasnella sp. 332]|nr:hypothetical protein FRB98_000506 [Tulasnella sp. 332]
MSTIMPGHRSILNVAQVLVREEYTVALEVLNKHVIEWPTAGMVVTGHPGMGSVTVLRLVPLLDGKEGYDILTRQWQVLLLLAHEGVMSHHSESGGYTARSVLSGTIALIDLSEMVTQPATYIPRDSSPFFVIQVAFPRSEMWNS